MGVKEVESLAAFESALAGAGDKAVLVDFFATWCGPCKMIGPKLEAMSGEYPTVVFLKVDVDKAEEVSEKHGISAMPTFLMFKKGEKVGEVVGANEAKLMELIKANA